MQRPEEAAFKCKVIEEGRGQPRRAVLDNGATILELESAVAAGGHGWRAPGEDKPTMKGKKELRRKKTEHPLCVKPHFPGLGSSPALLFTPHPLESGRKIHLAFRQGESYETARAPPNLALPLSSSVLLSP